MKNNYFYILAFLLCSLGSYAQCLENTHTPFEEDSWLSCQTAPNPNPIRPAGHWIMYDLGFEYVLDSVHIWNLNTWGNSDAGVQKAVIDYSIDGVNWTSLDTFTIAQASASYKYQGVSGPSFNHTPARYVVVTALSNWGNQACTGLSEIRFGVSEFVSTDPVPELANASLLVQPNPVEDIAMISIQSENLPERVGLYDLSGRLIMEQTSLQSKNVRFDMEGLVGGVYIVKAALGEFLLTEKIIKVN